MNIDNLLDEARKLNCSDIHFTTGLPPVVRQHGTLKRLSSYPVCTNTSILGVIDQITDLRHKEQIASLQDCDLCYNSKSGYRHRVNIYRQKGDHAIAIRLLRDTVPTLKELRLPEILGDFAVKPRGLVLVTGPTGSGKSTTLAAMINHINKQRNSHVIIIEDPIEYLHKHGKSMINQREIGQDVDNFADALRSALREDPDVILVGEMRDFETINAAITAAETGHLVMSTVHTTDAASTIDRIIDVFPPHQQQQVRTQLASTLVGICSQQLIPKADNSGRIAALEVLVATDAVSAMVRENKVHQIPNAIQTGRAFGMLSRDQELARHVLNGTISYDEAKIRTSNPEDFERFLKSPGTPAVNM